MNNDTNNKYWNEPDDSAHIFGYTPVYGTLSLKIDEIVDSSQILDEIVDSS